MSNIKKQSILRSYKRLFVVIIIFLFLSVSMTPAFTVAEKVDDYKMPEDLGDKSFYEELLRDKSNEETPGTIPGSFNVNSIGQASYSIPIKIPPGTVGMQPRLSIVYNSGSGNGLLGVGFGFEGLSSIRRDACDLQRDGYISTSLSDEGRLSLDGSRLVVVYEEPFNFNEFIEFSQYFNYHSDLVSLEFRKQYDDNTRIKAYGNKDIGLAYFSVESPNGITSIYGKSELSDGRIYASSSNDNDPYIWALSLVYDKKGNYISYEYEKDPANSRYWITSIKYTGNTHFSPEILPYNEIRFCYESRNDQILKFTEGSIFKITNRLSNIQIWVENEKIFEYSLSYFYDNDNGKSLLNEIQLFQYSDKSVIDHLPSTIFNWTGSDPVISGSLSGNPDDPFPPVSFGEWDSIKKRIITDVNGDARHDIVIIRERENYHTSHSMDVLLSTGNSFTHVSSVAIDSYNESDEYLAMDINGNGRSDIVRLYVSNDNYYLQIWWSEGGFFHLPHGQQDTLLGPVGDSVHRFLAIDVNGDGMQDLAWIENSDFHIFVSTGDFLFYIDYFFGLPVANAELTEYIVIDMNGDGREDIVQIHASELIDHGPFDARVTIFMSHCGPEIFDVHFSSYQPMHYDFGYWGTRIDGHTFWENRKYNTILAVDINGDGLPDLIKAGKASNETSQITISYWLNDGKSGKDTIQNNLLYLTEFDTGLEPFTWNWIPYFKVADVNMDGKQDIIIIAYLDGETYDRPFWVKSCDLELFVLEDFSESDIGLPQYDPYPVYDSIANIYEPMDVNGDGRVELVKIQRGNDASQKISIFRTWGSYLNHIYRIKNGLDISTYITYCPLTEDNYFNVYRGHSGLLSPNSRHAIFSIWVVALVEKNTGVFYNDMEKREELYYEYQGAKYHLRRNSFLGFEKKILKQRYDAITERINIVTYYQDYPLNGLIKKTETRIAESGIKFLLQTESVTYDCDNVFTNHGINVYQILFKSKSTRNYNYPTDEELSLEYVYVWNRDFFGNPTEITKDVRIPNQHGNQKETSYIHLQRSFIEYENHVDDHWLIGLPNEIISEQAFDYYTGFRARKTNIVYNQLGFIYEIINEPDGNDDQYLQINLEYDSFGNIESITSTYKMDGYLKTDQMLERGYDDKGQFLVWEKNAQNHQTIYEEWHGGFGLPLVITDYNGLTTSFEYDGFGRIKLVNHPDQTNTYYLYSFGGSSEILSICYTITQINPGQPIMESYFDKFGREVLSQKQALSGKPFFRTIYSYDIFGRLINKTLPHLSSDYEVYYTTFTYDVLNRVKTITKPFLESPTYDFRLTSYDYDGFTTTKTDPLGFVSVTRRNALGQIIEIENDLNQIATFKYDSSGNLIKKTDPAGVETSYDYDILNRLEKYFDPNSGLHSFSYNALNQVVEKVDNKGQLFKMQYDDLGRMIRMDYVEGYNVWVYDEGLCGIGNLNKSARYSNSNNVLSQTLFGYDDVGRLQTQTTENGGGLYSFSFDYDQYSRLRKMTYPTGVSLLYDYNSNGYNTKIMRVDTINKPINVNTTSVRGVAPPGGISDKKDVDSSSGQSTIITRLLWELVEMSPFGHVTKQRFGNNLITTASVNKATGGIDDISCSPMNDPSVRIQNNTYVYDKNGNLLERFNQWVENFVNKQLHEFFEYDSLNRLVKTEGTATDANIGYHPSSNSIWFKSDVVPSAFGPGMYNYDFDSGPAYAVNSISKSNGDIWRSFVYDDNGNMVENYNAVTGELLEFMYDSFNMPMQITKSDDGVSEIFISYSYDEYMNKNGKFEVNFKQGVVTRTRFINNLYEEFIVDVPDGIPVEKRHYIFAAGRPVAMYTITGDGSIYDGDTHYLHSDILGSVEVITDSSGDVVNRFGYDAWGKRRHPDGNAFQNWFVFDTDITDRGFTGHRHVDSLGLIDMNARMYDPVIGMFVSVDPLGDGYRYANNNPLRFFDSTGLYDEDIYPPDDGYDSQYDPGGDRPNGPDGPQEPNWFEQFELPMPVYSFDGIQIWEWPEEEDRGDDWGGIDRMPSLESGQIHNEMDPGRLEHRDSSHSGFDNNPQQYDDDYRDFDPLMDDPREDQYRDGYVPSLHPDSRRGEIDSRYEVAYLNRNLDADNLRLRITLERGLNNLNPNRPSFLNRFLPNLLDPEKFILEEATYTLLDPYRRYPKTEWGRNYKSRYNVPDLPSWFIHMMTGEP
jgi:RHS repeat-associated protein